MSQYVVLQEQDRDFDGDMYYFIRLQGNEDNLKKLAEQLDKIECWEWDNVVYTIDLDHPVSETTANEMCAIELNRYMHGKFNKLLPVDFKFKSKDSDRKMQKRVATLFGGEGLLNFLQDEDKFGRTSSEEEESSDDSDSSSSESESESEEEKEKHKKKKVKGLPPAILKRLKDQKKHD